MRTAKAFTALFTVIGIFGLSAGCDKPPVAPSAPPPVTVSVQQLEIQGREAPEPIVNGNHAYLVPPGETVEFRAIARFSDGTSRDVTNEAAWRSSNFSFLSVAGTGLYTGQSLGAVTIEAAFERTSGRHDVIVMPRGTYVLGGQVIESRDPLATVSGAQVLVLTGPGAGQFASTDSARPGFRSYGLVGATTIRVAKDGYRTVELRVMVVDHQALDIDLPLAAPRHDVSGAYTLTLTASDECGIGRGEGQLPEEARERKYTAHVTQRGPELSVELSGAAFTEPMPSDRRITGRVEPSRVLFDLTWWDAYWDVGPPRIVERLSTGEILIVSGSAVTTVSNGGVAGTLSGAFYLYAAGVKPDVRVPTAAICSSPRHRFTLSRF